MTQVSQKPTLYQRLQKQAQSPKAMSIVTIVSFLESSIFPLPPDILIVPMVLTDRRRAWRIAFWCSVASVLGAFVGYVIGHYLYQTVGKFIINTYQLQDSFDLFSSDFQEWGFWIIMIKGITPIPFKLVTIASGVFHLDLLPFFIACTITRFGRFYGLCAILWFSGKYAKDYMERYIGWILGAMLAIMALGFYLVKLI